MDIRPITSVDKFITAIKNNEFLPYKEKISAYITVKKSDNTYDEYHVSKSVLEPEITIKKINDEFVGKYLHEPELYLDDETKLNEIFELLKKELDSPVKRSGGARRRSNRKTNKRKSKSKRKSKRKSKSRKNRSHRR